MQPIPYDDEDSSAVENAWGDPLVQPKRNGLSITAIVLSGAAILVSTLTIILGYGPWQYFQDTDPYVDGYVPPRSIATLVDNAQNSTVTVYCDYAQDTYSFGTAWAMDIETDYEDEYPTALVTNHHVIANCLDGQGKLFVKKLGGNEYPAVIDNWNEDVDLAVIATKLKLDPLPLSPNIPYPGYWVMAVGSPQDYEGSVAFGNVLNVTEDDEILITASLSGGNSGGPLIDNEGYVIGINTWRGIDDVEYNGAKSLDAMCDTIMQCDGETYWDWEE